jgi:predicted chitinase
MSFIKFLVFSLSLLLPINILASQEYHTTNHTVENINSAVTCQTKINNYQGSCIKPSDCNGGVYNNLCSGSVKCCIQDVNSSPWSFWKYVSREDFKSMFPLLSETRINILHPWFNDAIGDVLNDKKGNEQCDIISAFAAQVGHESLDLTTFEEFASGEAYEGRCKQLGNCYTGDGVKYKGRGAIQISGRSNYEQASSFIGEDFINKPDLLVLPSYGFKASVWFWTNNNLNQYCTGNLNNFIELTKKINGGINGLEDRINKWNRAKTVLSCY